MRGRNANGTDTATGHGASEPGEPEIKPVYGPPTMLRLSAGYVYFHFGILKLFPDLSPAELIAGEAITRVSFHMLDMSTALFILAWMEVLIGLCFLFDFQLHRVFYLFLFHQAGTFAPLVILPELAFKFAPFAPTMEGQYILKNVVSVAAGLTVLLPVVRARGKAKKLARQRRRDAGAPPTVTPEVAR